jgi:DNA ligase 1
MKLPTLYSRTSTGAVQEWAIEIEGNQYRTISGQVGGKKVQTAWTTCAGKNVGRANETTPEQQAQAEAQAKWKKQTETGYFEYIGDIDNETYIEPMLAKEWGKRKDKVKFPVFSQPKLDGIRCVLSIRGMFSRNGKEIAGAPHIYEYFREFFEEHPDAVFDGELYADHLNDDFNKIVSMVKKAKPTPEELEESRKNISYWVYDYISEGALPFLERFKKLADDMANYDTKQSTPTPVVVVPTHEVHDEARLDELYGAYMEEGHEGQMVRLNEPYEHKRSNTLLKRKEFMDEEFEILDVIEGKGNRSGMAGNMVVRLKDGSTCDPGIKGNYTLMREYLINKDKYIGKLATVKFFNYTPDGKLRFPHVIKIDRAEYE